MAEPDPALSDGAVKLLGMGNEPTACTAEKQARRTPYEHSSAPERPIQADRHPGVRLRHLGSDPSWRGQTPSVRSIVRRYGAEVRGAEPAVTSAKNQWPCTRRAVPANVPPAKAGPGATSAPV